MRLAPVDINFLKHIELDAVSLRELLDLGIRARLLGPELITGEGEDGQPTLSLKMRRCHPNIHVMTRRQLYLIVLLVQLDQLGVVGLGLASSRGNIDNHTDLALVPGKIQ